MKYIEIILSVLVNPEYADILFIPLCYINNIIIIYISVTTVKKAIIYCSIVYHFMHLYKKILIYTLYHYIYVVVIIYSFDVHKFY